jgi:uncharacterized glyoxalase superfamily protein PhnB
MVMFAEGDPGDAGVYVAVEDVEAVFASAKAAGATITRELNDTDYGSREFSCRDPEGARLEHRDVPPYSGVT